eukprot:TRINITY_DN35331_c0_g1_i1.p1 TRINITY_DN35331_c0_g1~~TRINITY_DN35331_c0_g1_i1.p1  ORF type:complete len:214 (-),score=68.74 TRINITY_DN35331_c0_g1_i1:64-705(-)
MVEAELPPQKECLFKVLVVGDLGVGKTSFIRRYVNNVFGTMYKPTIGVDFALKAIDWDEETKVRLQLWDIAGQERYGNMTRVYYREAVGAIVMFDVSRGATFEAVESWKGDIDKKVTLPDGSPIPVVLVANKCDLASVGMADDEQAMEDYCKANGYCGFYLASAQSGQNVDISVEHLVAQILDINVVQPEKDESLELRSSRQKKKKQKSGCCA